MTAARDRWDERHGDAEGPGDAAAFLDEVSAVLPSGGSMVDIAGGRGGNARWFSDRGFDVTVIDVSPVALAHVRRWATAHGVEVETVERDLEVDGLPPARRWDVALMHMFFDRDVLSALPAAVNPGGLILFAQPTPVNLERHSRPSRRFLIERGELAEIVGQMSDVDVVQLDEAWRASGRHEARLIARRT